MGYISFLKVKFLVYEVKYTMRYFSNNITALRASIRYTCSLCEKDNEFMASWSGVEAISGFEKRVTRCSGCNREVLIFPYLEVYSTEKVLDIK